MPTIGLQPAGQDCMFSFHLSFSIYTQICCLTGIHIMLIEYARVSTDDQHPDLLRDALTQAGCERILKTG